MHIKIHVPGDDSYRREHETRHRYRSDFEARYVNFMYFHNQRKWRRVVCLVVIVFIEKMGCIKMCKKRQN